MRTIRLFLLLVLIPNFLAGCIPASRHQQDVANANADRISAGNVQGETREGMSSAEVVEVLGSPNMVTTDEETLLFASAAVLQDLGFKINESEAEPGVIVDSRKRDATSPRQVVGAAVVVLLTGVMPPIDKEQVIRASLVTRPIQIHKTDPSKCLTEVRIAFQRIVSNSQGQITRQKGNNEARVYQTFFDKLAQYNITSVENLEPYQ